MNLGQFIVVHWASIRGLILCAAAAPLAYYLATLLCGWDFFRHGSQARADFLPGVSLLKPMKGLDRETYENLASFCRQDYPQFEILFGFSHPQDAAVPVVKKIMADFPGVCIRMLTGTREQGANNKVAKLCGLARVAQYDLLVVSDSDTRVGANYLRRIAAPFSDSRLGAATSVYRGMAAPNPWSELEALSLSTEFIPSALVARKLGMKFALGATMAVRRQALEAIGGFESLADMAADDHELGRRVAAQGYGVEFVDGAVCTECGSRSFREYFRHQVRWSVVTRESKPWGHFGFIFAQGLPWTILAADLSPTLALAAGFIAAYLVLRFAVAFTVGAWGLHDPLLKGKWWWAPISDALSFLVWSASLFTRRVYWQGVAYDVRRGRLLPAAPDPIPTKGIEDQKIEARQWTD
ncbi:MAG TPA: bacteriohopanetetrol glucosamine biosynthesis glycosyltransferase HpnI [Terriglobia bacterium]|nr:bacteriohopanetetrol glucosamine biosynthesis glycosyltransferase HpnI [Terriglobia bacterium]